MRVKAIKEKICTKNSTTPQATYPGQEINTTIATVGYHGRILLPSIVSTLVLIVSTLVLIVSTLVLIVSTLILIVSTLVLIVSTLVLIVSTLVLIVSTLVLIVSTLVLIVSTLGLATEKYIQIAVVLMSAKFDSEKYFTDSCFAVKN